MKRVLLHLFIFFDLSFFAQEVKTTDTSFTNTGKEMVKSVTYKTNGIRDSLVYLYGTKYDRVQLKRSAVKGYIQNGQKVPDFTLPTHEGKEVSLKDYHGKYLLLIFVRGDWCPGCHIMLRSYERNRERFAAKNVELLAIGPDPQGVNRQMMDKLGLHYELLSDEKQQVAMQFCVELQKPLPNTPHLEFIPLPASFLIDKEGILRYSSRADRAGEILQPEKIFEVLSTI